MLHTIWIWLQGLFALGQDGLAEGSGSDSGHGVDPNG